MNQPCCAFAGLCGATDRRALDARVDVLMAEVCDAVQQAHERGVVQRDLKPDNVLIAALPAGLVYRAVKYCGRE